MRNLNIMQNHYLIKPLNQNKMNKTAVEWLESYLNNRLLHLTNNKIHIKEFVRTAKCAEIRKVLEIIEQAKAMEKNQHNETWDSAHQAGRFEGKGIAEENWQTFETHWEETFKSE